MTTCGICGWNTQTCSQCGYCAQDCTGNTVEMILADDYPPVA